MARVLISMPEEFLNKIDGVAETENRTRSDTRSAHYIYS